MSTTEDHARAAMRAIAATVNDAPPLKLAPARQLTAAVDEVPSGSEPGLPAGRGRGRRWHLWLVPAAAAAAVVALAVSLAVVKDIPNGSVVPKNPAAPTTGPGGAPRYYAALKTVGTGSKKAVQNEIPGTFRYGIVVGDSVTGKTLATFTPPARTTFQSVSAAADGMTFAVFAVTSTNGSFIPTKGVTLTGSWYKLRLAPGTSEPARLSKLPVKPWSWDGGEPSAPVPGEIFATALSQSGRELAVADVPDIPAATTKTGNWHEVKVFSVATGRLLHDWTENNPRARLVTVLSESFADVPARTPSLTWIDGDRALALATSYDASNTVTGTVRRLDLAGPASGNLMKDSKVIWSGTLTWNDTGSCFAVTAWPPQISADGKTFTCLTVDMPNAAPGHIDFGTAPLTTATQADVKPTVGYRATIPPEKKTGGVAAGILWASPSADTLIVEWEPGGNLSPHKQYFGVVRHGKFTPLRVPASLMTPTTAGLTF